MSFARHFLDACDYFSFRAGLLASSVAEWMGPDADDGRVPAPPPLLRFRVHGAPSSRADYLRVGQVCAHDIMHLLGAEGRFHAFERALDFGCGSGRVLRFLHEHLDSCRLHGTDIDRQAIAWCRKHLPIATWSVNHGWPPTAFDDHSFDFIYAISVFTHMDEPMQFAWLDELKRIARPGAALILTVRGDGARSRMSEAAESRFRETGFSYTVSQTGMFKRDGLPGFHQLTDHSRAYVEDHWSRYFEILKYVERGMNSHQDAVLLRNS